MLTDMEIIEQHQALEGHFIQPFSIESLSPCSYDLALGTKAIIDVPQGFGTVEQIQIDLTPYSEEHPFHLLPNAFILTEVQEVLSLPSNIAGTVSLRSTYARMGLNHSLAGHVDPGYYGRLTLELKNIKLYKAIPLWPGLKVCQIVFTRLDRPAYQDYSTPNHHYYGDMEVKGAKL